MSVTLQEKNTGTVGRGTAGRKSRRVQREDSGKSTRPSGSTKQSETAARTRRSGKGRARAEAASASNMVRAQGVLELHPKGYGFLRDPQHDLRPTPVDAYLPDNLIADKCLRPGNYIEAYAQQLKQQQGPRVEQLLSVDGRSADEHRQISSFDELTAINPEDWLQLQTGAQPLTTRVMDLLTPLGKGQRALIVAPPRSGKTVLLQHIGQAIAQNYPAVKLMVMLVDERPEEVTDMRRQIPGDVFASSLDQDIESHTRLSQLVVERGKRLAEQGEDVVLLVDSLTRMSRAFNKRLGNGGRTMTGGVDIRALDIPKKLFASARAFEEGGSLTIIATALIETGSRMDDLIFQEFKGTGNMELVLDRKLADRRIWPAIDVTQSGTRREEKLLPPDTLHAVTMLRRMLSSMDPTEAMEKLIAQLGRFKSNEEFLKLISQTRAA